MTIGLERIKGTKGVIISTLVEPREIKLLGRKLDKQDYVRSNYFRRKERDKVFLSSGGDAARYPSSGNTNCLGQMTACRGGQGCLTRVLD